MGRARQTRKSSGSRSEKSKVNLGTQGQLLTIVGMPGAGKSVVVDHLRSKGWSVVHFGAVTMRELERRGLVVNELNERFVREDLRKKHGMATFAKLSMGEVLSGLSKGPTVIDGLYSWSEYKFLRNQLSERFFVVNVFTSRQIRYDRLLHREVRPLSHEEAEARDFAEIENLEKGGPIAMADFTLQNDETMEKLHSEIDKLLELLAPS
jgi:dephospho-CoA kinase